MPVLGSKPCISVVIVCGVLNLTDKEQTFVLVYDCLLFTGTKDLESLGSRPLYVCTHLEMLSALHGFGRLSSCCWVIVAGLQVHVTVLNLAGDNEDCLFIQNLDMLMTAIE